VAALIADETSVTPELVEGRRGEFTIWVGDREVAAKSLKGFPADAKVLAAVKSALAGE
jgi:hypothetical protein